MLFKIGNRTGTCQRCRLQIESWAGILRRSFWKFVFRALKELCGDEISECSRGCRRVLEDF